MRDVHKNKNNTAQTLQRITTFINIRETIKFNIYKLYH